MSFFPIRPAIGLLPFVLLNPASLAGTEFGNLLVRQLNGTNNSLTSASPSVSLALQAGASTGVSITGGNRGDYNLSFGNTSDPAAGVLITSPSQNSRDDSAVGGPAIGAHQATTAVEISGARYYVPVFRAPEGDEANINVSFAFLPYNTWAGGVAVNAENGGPITSLTGSPGLVRGTHFIDSATTEGIYRLNLSPLVTAASQNGVLLVTGAKNEDNHALSQANTDGSFSIFCHDNGSNGASYENDPVAFSYLPKSAVGTNNLVAIGRVNGNATTDVAAGSFTVRKGGTGQWLLSISGHTHLTGTLLISAEGGATNNADNIVSAEWDEDNGRWIVESRDLPGVGLQNMDTAAEDAFSFAFFSRITATGNAPEISLTSPANAATHTAGSPILLAANASDDGAVSAVRFYDGEVLLGTDTSPPYQFTWNAASLGTHTLNARVTDNRGFVTRSAPATINVVPASGSGGLYFDGTDDFVTFGNSPAFRLVDFTLECWFRREPGGVAIHVGGIEAIPLVAKGRTEDIGCNFFLGIDEATGKIAANFKDRETGGYHPLVGKTHLPDGVWHHAAATCDGDEFRLYLNGNLEAAVEVKGSTPRSDSVLHTTLGTSLDSNGTPGGWFSGFMDEVRVWNRARTSAEIRSGLNSGIPTASGLVARYDMNEISGDIQSSVAGAASGILTNGVSRTTGAPFDLDVPPAITATSPSAGQSGVPRNARLQVLTEDPDDTSLTVRYFGRDTASGPLSDFTLVALPDTQFYSENEGGNLGRIFSAQTDWIVSQRKTLGIEGVLHLGDITQYGDKPATAASEWAIASDAMYRLENPLTTLLPHGIPYVLAVGNHDQTPIGNADGTTTGFNTWFGVHPTTGVNHFAGKPYYGGTSVPHSADNNYILFSAGGLDFIVISFEFDNTPDDDDLAWADALLKAHPTRCGIIITHWTVNTGNPAAFSPQGSAIYEALKNNPNLILMHGGHIAGEGRRSDTWQGRTVHSLLADYQSRTNGGDGWLRILKFRPSLNRIEIKTYSPTLNRYETDADSQFNLSVDLMGRGHPFEEIGTVAGPPGETGMDWGGLDPAGRYEWYAETSDGTSVAKTDVRTFTTTGTQYPPTVSLDSPANAAVFTEGQPITLQATASDPDGQIAKVRYFSGTTLLGESTTPPHAFLWENPPVGTHTLFVKAIDNEGLEGSALPTEVRVVAKPKVSILATDAAAGEFGEDQTLAFTFSRDGGTDGSLEVDYHLSGTATAGADFTTMPGSVSIPDGRTSAVVSTTVLTDDLSEGDETLTVTLVAKPSYELGVQNSATAMIGDRPFSAWLHQHDFGGPSDDHDQDGVPNIIEYYTGGRGDVADGGNPIRAIDAGDGVFVAHFKRSKEAVDVTATIEWSTDLENWHLSGAGNGSQTAVITTRVISPDENPETLEAKATITAGPLPASFHLRLAVRP
ncbi:metallophosphoesterase [Luteolibacter yonseiensis]|uniref:Metallophosphoesterase n=1 Tax=Luteolibacter yonseiensis TaxID=1144680 RepID=A0A934V8X3_9BACT|nr:Ig-like domain-containing protein [Luteolibacter yonseiensis]MBK1814568.1 metallophosphoesterase [Luteolibacter yonseiensis]